MVKTCKKYYMIDVHVGPVRIRPRKYCKEYTNTQVKWYDYNWNPITYDFIIQELESKATPDKEVDEAYDEYMAFMTSSTLQTHLTIPVDKHFTRVDWTPTNEEEFIKMGTKWGLDGDSYLIYVRNVGTLTGTLRLHVDLIEEDEWGLDPNPSYSVPVHAESISVPPKMAVAVRATYRDFGGRDRGWYYEIISKPETSGQGGGIISISSADFLVFRYLWDKSSGTDLDTATELVNSGIPGVDGNAVGWDCPGNNIPAVTSLLRWGGDNRTSGNECVYIDIKELREKYMDVLPPIVEFMTYATWFSSKGSGEASFSLIAYKGGSMEQQGYNFINTGGEEIYNKKHSFQVETIKGIEDYRNKYTPVTKITYDKQTNTVSMAVGETIIDNQNSLQELYNLFSNYLAKDNQTPYTPVEDYNPATKKYVDDNADLKADKKATEDALDLKLNKNLVGVAGGVAELGDDGRVPSRMLPSYVDDVIDLLGFVQTKADLPTANIATGDAYYVIDDAKIYTYDGTAYNAGQTPEGGKIYQTLGNNKIWRWSGSAMVTTGSDLALGETAQTAYAGNKGKKNADDIAALATRVTAIEAQIGDIGTILDNINGEAI